MREVVLDTETTGLDPENGDRIVEIGCLELVNHLPTGRTFHRYTNPERPMPEAAFAVHGLSDDFLSDKPVFAEVAGDFLDFIGDDPLVIHNAKFDLGFINAELKACGQAALAPGHPVHDTLATARAKFPGAQASLDALCRRFGIDLSVREKHGALLDAELLSEVYLELVGGRQPDLSLAAVATGKESAAPEAAARAERTPRPLAPTTEEAAAHEAFIATLENPVWER